MLLQNFPFSQEIFLINFGFLFARMILWIHTKDSQLKSTDLANQQNLPNDFVLYLSKWLSLRTSYSASSSLIPQWTFSLGDRPQVTLFLSSQLPYIGVVFRPIFRAIFLFLAQLVWLCSTGKRWISLVKCRTTNALLTSQLVGGSGQKSGPQRKIACFASCLFIDVRTLQVD